MGWEKMAREMGLEDTATKVATEVTGLLFARTMVLVVGMLTLSGLMAAWCWDWVPSTGALVVVIILSFGLVFAASALQDSAGALIPAGLFALTFGALLGPTLQRYVAELGSGTVTAAICLTIGVMAACALIASIFVIPYRKLEGPLLFCLFGLILYSVITIFTGIPNTTIDMGYSILGCIIFTLYFLVDFARLYNAQKHGSETWGEASTHAVYLYLDFMNLLLYILRLWKK